MIRNSVFRAVMLGSAAIGGAAVLWFGYHTFIASAKTQKGAVDSLSFTPTPYQPIASEALVFRSQPGVFAVTADAERRTSAHPRTIATYRALREFPGAPPRIPHGITAGEFQESSCRTCHERGGFSPRFAAYAPVTPHPEQVACVQCHLPDAQRMGIPLPARERGTSDACTQCHNPTAPKLRMPRSQWVGAAWPRVGQDLGTAPPPIPHDLQTRGNCLACHMGPNAVREIRTTHPERSNCRQCHLAPERADDTYRRTDAIQGGSTVRGTGGSL